MAKPKIKSVTDDDSFEGNDSFESEASIDLVDLSANARQLKIRRRIEDSLEARRIKEELGFNLY
jgi:hypothetical protein